MNNKKIRGVGKKNILTGCIVLIIILILYFTGIFGSSAGTGIKIGWAEDTIGNKWKASYAFFLGSREKKLNIEGRRELQMNVKTDKGQISVEISDENENIIYSEKDIQSIEKKFMIEGIVKIKVSSKGHKGSFEFKW